MTGDILVVDDEPDIRELVAGILSGRRLCGAHRRGLRTRRWPPSARASPSLLILDIWMQGGGMDGLELLDLVKELDPDLPVVMISGHGNIETAVSAIKRGAYDFLEKPFKSDRLLLVVERALEATQPAAREPAPAHARRRRPTASSARSPAAQQLRQTIAKVATGQQPAADLRPGRAPARRPRRG